VAELGVQAAEALDHAHQLGIVHRDVKPGNLMLDRNGGLWVMDFGLAQFCQAEASLTVTGGLVGTLPYMSPEQALAQRAVVDHRTDVYSLGATLYELLTLRPAFGSGHRHELLRQIAFDEPTPLRRIDRAIPVELETIVLKAMAKGPAERYATAQELADDLRRFLEDRPIRARRPTLSQRLARWSRRHQAVIRSAVVVLALVVVGLTAGTWLLWREKEETRSALAREAAKRRWARRAVNDMYSEVAEKWLAHEPHMTEVQRQFLARALGFYDELVRDKNTEPEERLELGIAYRRMGAIRDHGIPGRREGANEDLERAVAVLEALVREYTDNDTYGRELARSYRALGSYLWAHGRVPDAEKYLRQALEVFTRLAGRFPDAPDHAHDLADNLDVLGQLWAQAGRDPEAKEVFARAVQINEQLAARFPGVPGYREDLAFCYLHFAELLQNMGQLPAAEQACRKALDRFERGRREAATTPGFRSSLGGGGYNLLTELLLDMDRPGEAAEAVGRSLDIRRQAYADFPDLPFVWHGLALTYSKRGRFLSRLGRGPEAEEAFRLALEYQQMMVERFPTDLSRREEFALMNSSLAWLYLLGPEPVRDARKARPLVQRALELDPGNGSYLTACGVLHYRLGELDSAVCRFRQAVRVNGGTDPPPLNWVGDVYCLRRVAARNARAAAALNGFFLAMSYQRLGDSNQARNCYSEALRRWPGPRIDDPVWARELNIVRDETAALLGNEERLAGPRRE
jgi:tetratricopeptide (TPR) repeat protein